MAATVLTLWGQQDLERDLEGKAHEGGPGKCVDFGEVAIRGT